MALLRNICQALVFVSVIIGFVCVLISTRIVDWEPPHQSNEKVYSYYSSRIPDHSLVNHIPNKGRVAIILRGIPFRNPNHNNALDLNNKNLKKQSDNRNDQKSGCDKQVRIPQFYSIRSLLEMVIKPLEENNNVVDIIIASSVANCTLLNKMISLLGGRRIKQYDGNETGRVISAESFNSIGQLTSLKFASDTFLNTIKSNEKVSNYNLIIYSRMDIFYNTPIQYWDTNFSRFNFFSRCTLADQNPIPWPCVNDIFQTMPGKYFLDWSKLSLKCFSLCKAEGRTQLSCPISNGHNCYNEAVKLYGKDNVGLIIDSMKNDEVHQIAVLSSNYKLPATWLS